MTKKELGLQENNLDFKYDYEAHHDSLTQLPNRTLITEQISKNIEHSNQQNLLAVIIVKFKDFENLKADLSNFILNNILKQFAEKLKTILLEPPIPDFYLGMCSVAHLQNDEFAIILPGLDPQHQVDDLAKNLVELCSRDYLVDGRKTDIPTIAGIAIYPQNGSSAEELLHYADLSLADAQAKGLSFATYNTKMKKELTFHEIILEEVKTAIETESIALLFKPYFNINTKEIFGAETDLALESSAIGHLTSEMVWPHIENTILEPKLTRLMLKKAMEQLAQWHAKGLPINLSVPLTAHEIHDKNIPAYIAKLINTYQIKGKFLEVNFAEQACLNHPSETVEVLKALNKLEINLSIRDFCSGCSSFAYLTYFPINKLKIDNTFVEHMMESDKQFMLVSAMIKIAKTMRVQVEALGIKDEVQLEVLRSLGCQFGQAQRNIVSTAKFNQLFGTEIIFNN